MSEQAEDENFGLGGDVVVDEDGRRRKSSSSSYPHPAGQQADLVDVGCDAEVAELTCRARYIQVTHSE
jgi:hypothetical protein